MGRPRVEDRHPEIIQLISTMTNQEVASRYGVTRQTAKAIRDRIASGTGPKLPEITKDPHAVVVVFQAEEVGQDVTVRVLNSYEGTRVFHHDHLDPRITMAGPIPHFTTFQGALAHLMEEPGAYRPCSVGLGSAHLYLSGPWADYRPEPVEPPCPYCGGSK